jgi:hypothetical protein
MNSNTKRVLKASSWTRKTNNQENGFTEVRRWNRCAMEETIHASKQAAPPATMAEASGGRKEIAIPIILAPSSQPSQTKMPLAQSPPHLRRNREAATNCFGVNKQTFEFCKTRNGTRLITMDMLDFSAHFEKSNASYLIFFPKSEKNASNECSGTCLTTFQQRTHIMGWRNWVLTLLPSNRCQPTAGQLQREQPQSPVPDSLDGECYIPGNFQTANLMPHLNQGRRV